MTVRHHLVQSKSPEETTQIARALAPALQPGDVVLLKGPIGAGKSHFARSAIQCVMTEPEDIPSPTYTIVQTYLTPRAEVWHADLYRLTDAGELHELGLWTAFDEAISFVEWPERLGDQAPAAALLIEIDVLDEQARHVRFSWSHSRWDARLAEVLRGRSAIAQA